MTDSDVLLVTADIIMAMAKKTVQYNSAATKKAAIRSKSSSPGTTPLSITIAMARRKAAASATASVAMAPMVLPLMMASLYMGLETKNLSDPSSFSLDIWSKPMAAPRIMPRNVKKITMLLNTSSTEGIGGFVYKLSWSFKPCMLSGESPRASASWICFCRESDQFLHVWLVHHKGRVFVPVQFFVIGIHTRINAIER